MVEQPMRDVLISATRWSHRGPFWVAILTCGALSGIVTDRTSAEESREAAYFQEQVRPLLERRCYACHSHRASTIEGGLVLDWQGGWAKGGAHGPAIVPGQVEASLLIRAVRHRDPDLQMPEEKLPDEEIAILEEWVARGAYDPRQAAPPSDDQPWWSLRPLNDIPARPQTQRPVRHPIDAFLTAAQESQGVVAAPRADARTLIRRLMIDLHGLQPTWEELVRLEADASVDHWERLVDRLLASPRYGERWARHWLDAVHYADTHGYEHDALRPHAWHYRDYVIDAWNDDTHWSQFVREQLAADVFCPDDVTRIAALGFLGAGPYDQSAEGHR